MADTARGAVLPDQKGHQRARTAARIAVKQVQLFSVLVSARLLDEAQTEKAHVEIHIGLNISRDRCDVMDAHGH